LNNPSSLPTPSPKEPSDQELIVDWVSNNNNVAGDELCRRYRKSLKAFIATLDGYREAEDLIQTTFQKVAANRGRFDPEQPFQPWLLTIARNTVFSWKRRMRRVPFDPLPDDLHSSDRADKNDIDLMRAISKLNSQQRTIIAYFKAGYTDQETARDLGMKLRSMQAQKQEAFARIRDALQRHGRVQG
jgi:RNA polymerase sigma factor (sigma-70 family)